MATGAGHSSPEGAPAHTAVARRILRVFIYPFARIVRRMMTLGHNAILSRAPGAALALGLRLLLIRL